MLIHMGIDEYMACRHSGYRYKHLWISSAQTHPTRKLPAVPFPPSAINKAWSAVEEAIFIEQVRVLFKRYSILHKKTQFVSTPKMSAIFIEIVLHFCQKMWFSVSEIQHVLENKRGSTTRFFSSKSSNLFSNIHPQAYVWQIVPKYSWIQMFIIITPINQCSNMFGSPGLPCFGQTQASYSC